MVAEQGRGFEVAVDAEGAFASSASAWQVASESEDASRDPLVPGKFLSSTAAERNETMELMRRVASKSGTAIEPRASVHVTLWAATGLQKTVLWRPAKSGEVLPYEVCGADPLRFG